MPYQAPSRKATIDTKRASELLFPIAAFLRAGGMTADTATAVFNAALRKAAKSNSPRKIVPIGHPTLYADVVAVWARDKRFLDSNGRPRALSIKGRNGFASLVKSAGSNADAISILSVLKRYGNVKRTQRGKYDLVRPLFYTSSPDSMAFEPVAYFLSDAGSTLSKILKRPKGWKGPDLFWQKAESWSISEKAARKFAVFAKERSWVFLDELDDWLAANTQRRSRGGRRRRVGLGLFSIYSERELPDRLR